MDAKLINPIIDAFMEVMPQMGFPMPKRLRVYIQDRNVVSNGAILKVGFTQGMNGKVIYNMTAEAARYFASTMMLGVPVTKFGDMAKSALREMSNVLTARAATNFSTLGLEVDITTPELIVGEDQTIKVSEAQFLMVEMEIDGHKVETALAVESDI